MYFKAFLIALFAFNFTACSWWGERSKKSNEVLITQNKILKGKSADCINGIGSFFADYFKGNLSDVDISEMNQCIDSSLDNAFRLLKNSKETGINKARIMAAMRSVNSSSTQESRKKSADILFLVKRLIVGGDPNLLTYRDWGRVKQAIYKVAQAIKDTKKESEFIFFAPRSSLEDREKAYSKLKNAFHDLDAIRKQYGGEMTKAELSKLIFYILSNDKLKKFEPIAQKASPILVGESAEAFEDGMSGVFSRVWAVFELQSRLRKVDFSYGFLAGGSVLDALKSMRILSKSLVSWAQSSDGYKISINSINAVVEAMFDTGAFEGYFKDPHAISGVVETFFKRIFKKEALDAASFNRINTYFESWIYGQLELIKNENLPWKDQVLENIKPDLAFQFLAQEHLDIISNLKKPVFFTSQNEPISILYKDIALFPAESYFDKSLKYSLLSVALPVLRAYSGQDFKVTEVDAFIDKSGLEQLFYDFRPIGLEMGFSNPYSCEVADRVFKEANSLTFSGNGDDKISPIEAVEWLGTMIAVSSISSYAFSKADQSCVFGGDKVFGYNFLDRDCFKKSLFARESYFRQYFPVFSNYLDLLSSPSQKSVFVDKLNDWASWGLDFEEPNVDNAVSSVLNALNTCSSYENFPVSRAEFNSSVAISIYVENAFKQFDTTGLNQGWFSGDEQGHDLILDGKEVSLFLSTKFKASEDEFKTRFKEKLGAFSRLVDLYDMSEGKIKLDRTKALWLIKFILGESEEEPNPLLQNFCESVYTSSQNKSISFDSSEKLMCTADDMQYR